MAAKEELLVSYFAISGDVYPMGPTEVSPFSFKDRVEAAAHAGFVGFGLHPDDVQATKDQIGYAEMRRIVQANGIKYLEIEFLTNWFETGDKRVASDKLRAQMFEAASELGMKDIKVGPGFTDEPANVPLMIDELGKLCDEAAKFETDVVMEIMPWANVRTIDKGIEIVSGVNRKNGGLLIDIWHMARGNIPYSEIRKIPTQFLKAVEIDDASRKPLDDLWEDTIAHREIPGEGELDVPAFIREVKLAGYTGVYGTEVLSAKHRKLGLDEMARRLVVSSMAQFDKV